MPECYTHVYIAERALERCGLEAASKQAFLAGANGPDVLYLYKLWKRRPEPNLAVLAEQMHREKTGAVLLSLLQRAITPIQQSYVLGYVTHYTTDCILAPYFAAMRMPKAPYHRANGASLMASSIDAYLYRKEHKGRKIAYAVGVPQLSGEELAQVTTLLHNTIQEVYGQDVLPFALADSFHHNRTVRRLLVSRLRMKKMMARLLGPSFGVAKGWGTALYHFQPAPRLVPLPANWQNPFTKEQQAATLDEMLEKAEAISSLGLAAAMRFWLGEVGEPQLVELFGNNDMKTGLPIGYKKPAASSDKVAEEKETAKEEKTAEESVLPPELSPPTPVGVPQPAPAPAPVKKPISVIERRAPRVPLPPPSYPKAGNHSDKQ